MSPVFCSSLCRSRNITIIVLLVLAVVPLNGLRPGQHIPTYAGPYRAVVFRIWNTSDDYQSSTGKLWFRFRTTQVRGKQPQYGWGQSYVSVSVSDDMKVEARMASRSNNQWKKNAFVFNFDHACSFFKIHADSVARVLIGGDITCPGPVTGLREIKNQTFEFVFPKFPVMPYGRYLFTLAVLTKKIVMGVAEADVELVPRL